MFAHWLYDSSSRGELLAFSEDLGIALQCRHDGGWRRASPGGRAADARDHFCFQRFLGAPRLHAGPEPVR